MTWNGDKNKIVLVFLILVFLVAFMAIAFLKPDDGQTFQTLGGLLTGAFAALVMEMKGEKPPPGGPPSAP